MRLIPDAFHPPASRRQILKRAGFLGAIPLSKILDGTAIGAPSPAAAANNASSDFRTRVVLLGTAGGPTWFPNSGRVSAASALVVGNAIYLIDLGHNSTQRLAEAFGSVEYAITPGGRVQQAYPTYLEGAKALFFTHLHMDHTTDYPALLLCGQSVGLGKLAPLQVFGPGNRGILEDVYGPPGTPEPAIISPGNPTPGTREMTDLIFRAYAQTVNDFMRDMHLRNFTEEVNVTDITGVPTPTRDKNTAPWPEMAPLEICRFSDPWVRVRATLVNHGPVYPAFAFRFDTDDGSVVFSGDTGYPCKNLATMAKGADILVHEVIDPDFIYNQFANPTASEEAIIHHLLTAHTSINDVGKVAEEAGVKTLVLNHLVPGNAPVAHLLRAKANFSGQLIIGEDLMQIGVGQRRVASLQSPAHIRPAP